MENDEFDICDMEGVEKTDLVEMIIIRLVSKLPGSDDVNSTNQFNVKLLNDKLESFNIDQLFRLYYRNNLYEFLSESYITEEILPELFKFDIPSGNRSDIKDEDLSSTIDLFSKLILEYVSLPVQYEEKMNFCDTRTRESVLLTDTDL